MLTKKIKKISLFSQIFLSLLLVVTSLQMVSLVFLLAAPTAVQAEPLAMNLQVPIPGLSNHIVFGSNTAPIANYIKAVYTYAIGVVGIVAAVVLMIGGIMWITAGGNTSSVGEAKAMITASITGLVLALTSYLILSQVNPALVNLKVTEINPVPVTAASNLISCSWVNGQANTGASNCLKSDDSKCSGKPKAGDLTNPGCCCKYRPISTECSWSDSSCATGYETIEAPNYTFNNLITCGTDTDDGNLKYCCCKILEWNDWKFDPGISDQVRQADPTLRTLLGCMRKQLSRNQGRITSISDSNVVYPATMDRCTTNYTKPPCAHAKESCHYGCGGLNNTFSCAADFGDEDAAAVMEAANFCGAGFVLEEENPPHVHVSTESCPHN